MYRHPAPGAWLFVRLPVKLTPKVTHAWGRTPVQATVDGCEWKTSVWRSKDGRAVLAVPKRARSHKGDGDTVKVRLEFDSAGWRFVGGAHEAD
jgi:hypothetical protein